jgi:hypothetical protein
MITDLRVLRLTENILVIQMKNYRRMLVWRSKELRYLDDFSVYDNERISIQICILGSLEERKKRKKFNQIRKRKKAWRMREKL